MFYFGVITFVIRVYTYQKLVMTVYIHIEKLDRNGQKLPTQIKYKGIMNKGGYCYCPLIKEKLKSCKVIVYIVTKWH